jgi:hypothetical protein
MAVQISLPRLVNQVHKSIEPSSRLGSLPFVHNVHPTSRIILRNPREESNEHQSVRTDAGPVERANVD